MPASRNQAEFRCTACGRFQSRYPTTIRCYGCQGLLIRWPLRPKDLEEWFGGAAQLLTWSAANHKGKYSLRTRIARIFKPWFVRRREGQCQVLFALTELDGLIGEILRVVWELKEAPDASD